MAIATDDDTLLDGLNPAQREAVLHMDGPLLVLAGAGSGKTRVLTARIARLIDHHGVDPARILAVTFTNKAAGEMRDRIARLLVRAPLGMWVGTFHAIGARLLRAAPHLVGRTPSFTIYDQDDSQTIVKRILDRHQLNTKQFTPRGVQGAISDAKNALVSPEEYAKVALDPFSRAVATVYADLERDLRLANAADFDDLLVLPVRLLSANPEVLEKYRRRFQYLLVDEYQDTNRAQYQFVRLLAGERGNLCVVGDDDQSIYGWRGREIRHLVSYLKLIANPADAEAFRRAVVVPRRGLGETTIEQLALAAREAGIPMLAAAERSDLLGAVRPAARGALAEFASLIERFRDSAQEAGVDELLRDVVERIKDDENLRAEGPEGQERIENVLELITSAAPAARS